MKFSIESILSPNGAKINQQHQHQHHLTSATQFRQDTGGGGGIGGGGGGGGSPIDMGTGGSNQTGGPLAQLHRAQQAAAMAAAAAQLAQQASYHHFIHQSHHPYANQLAGLQRLLHLHPYRKPKRIRTAFSPGQLIQLEQAFETNHYVVGTERKHLAQRLNLTETQVKVWFQNRRTKHKRQKQEEGGDSGGGGDLGDLDDDSEPEICD